MYYLGGSFRMCVPYATQQQLMINYAIYLYVFLYTNYTIVQRIQTWLVPIKMLVLLMDTYRKKKLCFKINSINFK